ncbi:cyclase, partial [filamentous cyanobacterium CCP1]
MANTPETFSRQEAQETVQASLLRGEILLKTRSHSAWGGAITAQMYLLMKRSQVWQQLT